MKSTNLCLFVLMVLTAVRCVDPYSPAVKGNAVNMLIVDGFVNLTDQSASVRLSRSQQINDQAKPQPERGAHVVIVSSNGEELPLTETQSGQYTATSLNINSSSTYHLRIKTFAGKNYESDTVRFRKTPPIDKLELGISNDSLAAQVLVSTHDDTGLSRYYAWDYVEDYEYHAYYNSGYLKPNGIVRQREDSEKIYRCWRTTPSTTIRIGSSENLADDRIAKKPLNYLTAISQKISVRYSILVSQRTLGKAEYKYLTRLQQTTENVGSIFGSVPDPLAGNVHDVDDPGAPVLGYFSGSEVAQQRFWIERTDLPPFLLTRVYDYTCRIDSACTKKDPQKPNKCSILLDDLAETDILVAGLAENGAIWGYSYSSHECTDCRLQGGVTTPPTFW